MSFSHFGAVLEQKVQRGEKRANGNWVFSQVLVNLPVFKTAKHPLFLAHFQSRKLKPNLIHSLLVTLSHSFGCCLLWNEASKFWFVVLQCSLQVPGHWGAQGWHRMSHCHYCGFVWYQDLCFHLCSLIKLGITSARPKLGCEYVTSATCCCLCCNQWAAAPLTHSASILNLHFCSNTRGAAAAFSVPRPCKQGGASPISLCISSQGHKGFVS